MEGGRGVFERAQCLVRTRIALGDRCRIGLMIRERIRYGHWLGEDQLMRADPLRALIVAYNL